MYDIRYLVLNYIIQGIMKNIYEEINQVVADNRRSVVITIIDKQGSIPQNIGSTMLVNEAVYGTIGGGSLEANAIEIAKAMLINGESSKKLSFNLSDAPFNMICGGSIELFFNVIGNQKEIYIFGSGHVAVALYNVFKFLDFKLTFFDDRMELLNQFPNYQVVDYNNLNVECSNKYVIVVTRSHSLDFRVAETLKNQEFAYLGILGSKKKCAELFSEVKFVSNNVYAPIGLKVSNQNPNEIAISIAAQILAHKNERNEFLQ